MSAYRIGRLAVVLKDGAALAVDALREYLAEHLASFKIPAHIWFREDQLPRIASGKIFKRQLRSDYAEALSASSVASV